MTCKWPPETVDYIWLRFKLFISEKQQTQCTVITKGTDKNNMGIQLVLLELIFCTDIVSPPTLHFYSIMTVDAFILEDGFKVKLLLAFVIISLMSFCHDSFNK